MNKSTDNGSPFIIRDNSITGRNHKLNEDSRGVFRTTVQAENDPSLEVPAKVVVVADGIGGAVGGKEASRIAVKTIKEAIGESFLRPPISLRLEQAILLANKAIHQHVRENPQLKNMGSTVVVAIITDNRLYVSHAGDSRAYLIRQDRIHKLTMDHTWVEEAIAAGRLTPEEAAKHPNRNVVKRYLGTNETLIVDHGIIDIAGVKNANGQPQIRPSLELQQGDVVMLCTDGLSDFVKKNEMLPVIKKHKDQPEQAVDELINMAKAKGATDDITVVVVALREERKSRLSLLSGFRAKKEYRTDIVLLPEAEEKLNTGIVGASKEQNKANAGAVVQNRLIPVLLAVIVLLSTLGLTLLIYNTTSNTKESESAIMSPSPSATASPQNTAATETSVPSAQNTASPGLQQNYSVTTSVTPAATTTRPPSQDSTSTPVPTFTPVPTSTPLPSPTPTVNTQSGLVTLLEPGQQVTVKAIPVRFRIKVIGKQENDILELRMWIKSPDFQKPATTQWRSVEGDIYETDVERLPEGFTVGQNYSWTVILIGADGTLRDALAPARKIEWNKPTGYQRSNVKITLLEPARQSTIKNSSLQFKVNVSGMRESDALQLWMGTNLSHLQPVQVDWLPLAGSDEVLATLSNPPKGYGKQYYWTVTLVDVKTIPLPVPDASQFRWEE